MASDVSASSVTRVREQFRSAVGQPRFALWLGFPLVVLALLLDRPGLAIIIASLVVPVAVLIDLSNRDLFENEPWMISLAVVIASTVAGLFISLLTILLLKAFESERDPTTTCCGLFAGRVNLQIDKAGAVSIFLLGIVVPIVGLFLAVASPIYFRRLGRFRNEIMDGVTLGAAAGGGYAAISAIVYFWPLMDRSPNLGGSVSGWTAALIALLVVRPVVFCAAGALVCAGLWLNLGSRSRGGGLLPIAIGVASVVALAVGGLAVAGEKTVLELVWNLAILFGLLLAGRFFLSRALHHDRAALAAGQSRVNCPSCGKLTPPGVYCAMCGASLRATPVDISSESVASETDAKINDAPANDAEREERDSMSEEERALQE